jgi:hypothetical protein
MLHRLSIFGRVRSSNRWAVVVRGAPKRLPAEDGHAILTELNYRATTGQGTEVREAPPLLSTAGEGSKTEEPIQKRAAAFEHDVMNLLKRLGFQDVDGGANFKVNGVQVDACGGHEDTLLVIECTTGQEETGAVCTGET